MIGSHIIMLSFESSLILSGNSALELFHDFIKPFIENAEFPGIDLKENINIYIT